VAVLGRGIAVVKHANDTEVHALLSNRIMLRMRRKDIASNRQNTRWEAEASAPSSAKRHLGPKAPTSCFQCTY
jgi:hypothetical protein